MSDQVANGTENKVWTILGNRGRLLLEAFLLGTGLMLWVGVYLFSPINEIKTNIALIKQDINTIQLNHEQHIQDIYTQILDIKKGDALQDIAITKQNESIIRLLTKLNL